MALRIEKTLDPADQGLKWAMAIAACLFVGAVTFMYLATEENMPVLLPAAAIIVVFAAFVAEMQRRTPGEPVLFDLGVVFAAVVTVYAMYPLLTFIVNGLTYTESNNRLYQAMPTPEEVGKIAWYYWIFLTSFAIAYLVTRGGTRRSEGWAPKRLGRESIIAFVLLFVIAKVFLWGVGIFYDITYESYSESYLIFGRLPLIIGQIAGRLGGVIRVLNMALLLALFQDYRKYRWIIWTWLGAQVAATFLYLGARTEAVLLVFSATIMYHYLVKPIRWGPALCGALVAMILFLIAGDLRSAVGREQTAKPLNVLASNSEFEELFANAHDLDRRKLDGDIEPLPATFHFADFLSIVPQQVLPFQKVQASTWYVETYYPAVREAGGGMAFGVISESIVGLGMPELVLRGALVGWLLALFARRLSLRRPTAWSFLFHIWLITGCYQILRYTTFSMLPMFVWGFVPVYVFAKVVGALCADDIQKLPAKA